MIKATKCILAAVAISLLSTSNPVNAQDDGEFQTSIEGIRLVDGLYGNHMGRVEVMYNGSWGTICDDFWSFSDARVACRMLGYADALCAVTNARFGQAASNVSILMNNLQCRGTEQALDQCDFGGWLNNDCSHREDAGVVCDDQSQIGVPSNVRLVKSTTKSITVGWNISTEFPEDILQERFRIQYKSDSDRFTRSRFYFLTLEDTLNITRKEFTYTIPFLQRDTAYTIEIRAEARYPIFPLVCFSYLLGNYSTPVVLRTNNTVKPSNISIRLIPPESGLEFMGRLEVFHDNVWGTVCDDFFSTNEANVVCGMLNYTQGALCTVGRAGFGQGEGKIWLDNVDCDAGDEVLEECQFNPWGENNCAHRDDVGVICRPDDDFLAPVQNLTVSHVSATTISLRWDPYTFPSGLSQTQFLVQYLDDSFGFIFTRTFVVSGTQTEYTLTRLIFGREYNITIRPIVRFSQCRFNTLFGPFSSEVSATTQETAPTGPPTSFHVVILNSTSVEVQYDLPLFDLRNGLIRGYKIFVEQADGKGNEVLYNISGNISFAYIIGELKPATAYVFSVLAYTVADGPRSIHLTAITNPEGFDPVIIRFGINGNGLDKETKFTFQTDLHIHCSPSHPENSTVDWFFSNGTKVGNSDRNIREGHYANGTAVLQIASDRRLSYCDAGVYTCVVNTTSGFVQRKNFTLVINTTPPPPSRPTALKVESNSITIGWDESECDGGHTLFGFNIRYIESDDFSFFGSFIYIRNIDPNTRNYTINDLEPKTSYSFSIQAISVERRGGALSAGVDIVTLPPAPSAPRDVIVRVIRPLLIEVSWRVPSVTNGDIIHYTVYAIPLVFTETARAKRQTLATPKTIKMVFPGSARAGNITLTDHSVTYQFRVSAAITIAQTINEGELSSVTANNTVFIPEPGIPTAINLRSTASTNSSIILLWNYPPPPVEAIKSFLITYSGQVDWRSPKGTLVRFIDSGETTSTGTSAKVSQLIPGTSYSFRVSAITDRGRGAEVALVSQTDRPQSDKERLAYFQLRIGPIGSCIDFMDLDGNSSDKLLQVRKALTEELAHICPACNLTVANIKNNEFSCRGGLTKYIIYRARMVGTDVYSALGLVSLMQTWVSTGTASISVRSSSRLHLDASCPTSLDTLRSADCPMVSPPVVVSTDEKPVTKTTEENKKPEVTSKPEDDSQRGIGLSSAARSGEIGGIFVGSLVVILLAVLIVMLAIVMMKKWRPKVSRMRNGGNGHSHLDEDKTPFADIASHHEDSVDFKDGADKSNTGL